MYIFQSFVFREESQEFIDIGALNALFVLGRSMGFIGEFHFLTEIHKKVQSLKWLKLYFDKSFVRRSACMTQ